MSLFSKLSQKSREKKIELFWQEIKPTENTQILEIGSEVCPEQTSQKQFLDNYPWKENVTALNFNPLHIEKINEIYPQVKAMCGDACNLPFEDNSFDVVFSNAVIEHVGNYEKQKQMAKEIMRVSKSWFVTTPNRWYPFEFHLRLPFVTWLPGQCYLSIGRVVHYSHVKKKYVWFKKGGNFNLLSVRQLKELFENSKVIKVRITILSETLIVVGERE